MKTITKISSLLSIMILLAFSMTVISCSDDENDDSNDQIEDGTGKKPNIGISQENFATSWGYPSDDNQSWEILLKFQFNENGFITGAKEENDGEIYTWTVKSNPYNILVSENGDYCYKNIETNDKGFITAVDLYYAAEDTELAHKLKISYTADGYISTIKEDESTGGGIQCTYTWENGNLIKFVQQENKNSWVATSIFTYGNTAPTNSGIYMEDMVPWDCFDEFIGFGGFLGKPTKNIPVSCTETYIQVPGGDQEIIHYTYAVKYDNKNRITQLNTIEEDEYEADETIVCFGYDGNDPIFPSATGYNASKD